MAELKDLLKVALGFAGVAVCVWVYLQINLFFYERGWTARRWPKIDIQTLFHGNTKDKDQI